MKQDTREPSFGAGTIKPATVPLGPPSAGIEDAVPAIRQTVLW
jgi:hypothetical protein